MILQDQFETIDQQQYMVQEDKHCPEFFSNLQYVQFWLYIHVYHSSNQLRIIVNWKTLFNQNQEYHPFIAQITIQINFIYRSNIRKCFLKLFEQ
ncbi:unnamed protein product [Paramecium octaurelia]|uniref:Uncharacterized protein n=1 Tax=Paramecium octaurelia TaxID=43137 RepID=A0A8S1YKL8_PAROT|nr:unnamed protein product [Paramecium octaurelia]